MGRSGQTTLSIVLQGDQPPTEFRIFAAGKNDTTKGTFVFDATSARSVMAEYQAHGIDIPLDYDHAMLGTDRAPDPAQAGKAAGWFQLEVRSGELWAVNVRWTEPAAEALRRKEWRFMSPAFSADDKGRVLSLLNVAITNLPATRRLDPLMAASITALGAGMDPKLIKEALDALIAGDEAKCTEILKGNITSAAGADPDATTEDAPPPVGDGGTDEPAEMAADQPPPPEKEDKAAVAASISHMFRMTGATSMVSLSEHVTALVALRAEHDKNVAALAKEKAAIELGRRKENAVTLTKLGAETPHTTGLAKGKLCKRLLDEPLDEQNERVAALLSSRGGKLPEAIKPPGKVPAGDEQPDLTPEQLRICKETGCDPAVFAKLSAQRDSVKKTGGA